MESNCLLPVEMRTTFLRWWKSSIAVMKPEAEGWVMLVIGLGSGRLRYDTDQAFLDSFFDLFDFYFAESFDFEESSTGGAVDGLGW